jgi:Zn-dependent protease with chaperone function
MVGLGLVGLGVMVLFFLLKFIFKRNEVDRTGLIEVSKKEQPRLFEFIKRLAKETRTPLPKRIYLSQDVNASVFYDSGFWSMFFPVRKNLMIGLGLVNAVTTSEFKAIIAHEFGHFSQRSMALGSYVYNVNKVIYNLLYDNEGYHQAIEKWAQTSSYFAFFAIITSHIVRGIQWVLRQVYSIVNKQYLSLSRQMEFHADAVAASVSGGNHLISSLRRLEVAENSYNALLAFYSEHINKGMKPDNLYPQHREVMRVFSKINGLPVENDLPQVDANSFARFNTSRIVVKDQWASHPSTDDREAHLQSLHLVTVANNQPAWLFFDSPIELQRQFTRHIFEGVKYPVPTQEMDENAFQQHYQKYVERYQLPANYKGFFDSRSVSPIDWDCLETIVPTEGTRLEDLLTDEVLALPYRENGLANDLNVLDTIRNGNLQVKNFEWDGLKYNADAAEKVYQQLTEELNTVKQLLAEADRKIAAWFLHKAGDARGVLIEKYKQLFAVFTQSESDRKLYEAMQTRLLPLYQTMTFKQIETAVVQLKLEEVDFKKRLQQMVNDPESASIISEEQHKTVNDYLLRNSEYFLDHGYVQSSIDRLNVCLGAFHALSNEKLFNYKADVLAAQLELAGIQKLAVL